VKVVVVDRFRGQAVDLWSGRSPREQALLAGLAAVSLVALYLVLIYAPLQTVRAEAVRDIRTYQALKAQLRVAGPTLTAGALAARGPTSAVITASAGEFGLNIRRLDPDGERIRVVLEDVPFDGLVRWLDRLERDRGLRVVDLRVERRPAPGTVNAQATLED